MTENFGQYKEIYLNRQQLQTQLLGMKQKLNRIPVNAESDAGYDIALCFGRRDAIDAIVAAIRDIPPHESEESSEQSMIYSYNGYINKMVLLEEMQKLLIAASTASSAPGKNDVYGRGVLDGFRDQLKEIEKIILDAEGTARNDLLFPLRGL